MTRSLSLLGPTYPAIVPDDQPLIYVNQIPLVPRLCDSCERFPAVYWSCTLWPFSWFCRLCLDQGFEARRVTVALSLAFES